MRNPILLNKIGLVGLAAFLSAQLSPSSPSLAAVNRNQSADEMTRTADSLFASNKFTEAIELENQVIKNAPTYWLPHSALSIMEWRRSRYDVALKEAQSAVKLAPLNETAILNCAQMSQQLGYYEISMPLYRKAIKISNSNWLPRIGLMQCLISSARSGEALALLDLMAGQNGGSFDWWYQLANAYSTLDRPKQAMTAAQRALALATSTEQKETANAMLFVALVHANEIERAGVIENEVFKSKPKDDELYVLAATALYPVTEPSRGRYLINAAIGNILANRDGYYRIGEAFEEKSNSELAELKDRQAWLDNAEVAYRAAINAAPASPKYYLALAAIFDRKGRIDEMVAALNKAKALDASDALASYLVSRVKFAHNDLAGQLRDKLAGVAEKPYQLNLAKVDFQVDNLHCNCRLTALQMRIKGQDGIKFVAITNKEKPYQGTVLVDQSFGTDQAFETVGKRESVTLQVLASEPVKSVSQAIKISQTLRDAGQLSKTWYFVPAPPKMPVI